MNLNNITLENVQDDLETILEARKHRLEPVEDIAKRIAKTCKMSEKDTVFYTEILVLLASRK